MADSENKIKVEIFGTSYLLKGEGDPEYILEIASFVDQKMREIQQATGLISTLKIAILAALNIADELHKVSSGKKGSGSIDAAVTKKAIELIDKIEKELK